MRVLVTGPNSSIGRSVIAALLAAGHRAVGVYGDLLDAREVTRSFHAARPDAVVHTLTERGPQGDDGPPASDLVRATTNVVRAAVASGATRLVATSFVHAYGHLGWRIATEERPLSSRAPSASLQHAFNSIRALEDEVFRAGQETIESLVLRLGAVYGPQVDSTRFMLRLVRRRLLPLPGGGRAVMSWIHVDDAARAVVAALDRGRPGEIYNVVDDEPVSLRDYVTELAYAAGGRRPIPVPAWLARFGGSLAALAGTIELRVSNEKARRDLRWEPAFPTYRQGVRTLVPG